MKQEHLLLGIQIVQFVNFSKDQQISRVLRDVERKVEGAHARCLSTDTRAAS